MQKLRFLKSYFYDERNIYMFFKSVLINILIVKKLNGLLFWTVVFFFLFLFFVFFFFFFFVCYILVNMF